jgi:hypothetical protein
MTDLELRNNKVTDSVTLDVFCLAEIGGKLDDFIGRLLVIHPADDHASETLAKVTAHVLENPPVVKIVHNIKCPRI